MKETIFDYISFAILWGLVVFGGAFIDHLLGEVATLQLQLEQCQDNRHGEK